MSQEKNHPSDFLETHRDLFKNYTFKFEGLKDETEQGFKQVVKDLGANVSDDAEYTFCEMSYFKTDRNKERNDLYSICYILDSINDGKARDIQSYSFISEKYQRCDNHQPLCILAKFAISIDNCYRLNYEKMLCEKCRKNDENNVPNSEKCISDLGQNEDKNYNTHDILKVKNINEMMDEKIESNLEENLKSSKSSSKNQSALLNATDNTAISNERNASISSTNGLLVVNNKKCINSKRAMSDINLNDMAKKLRKSYIKLSNISDQEKMSKPSSSSSNEIENNPNNNSIDSLKKDDPMATNSRWIDARDIDDKKEVFVKEGKKKRQNDSDTSDDQISMSSDEEEEHWINKKMWWKPQKISKNKACDIQSCTYEPDIHAKHQITGRLLSLDEKKIMIKFLIQTNNIPSAKGIRVWQDMHDRGYLKHRSIETLRNCFRRTILPDIFMFGLPKEIVSQFLLLDVARKGKRNQ